MDLITGKNTTWLNPPHVGGIVDTDIVCPQVYCSGDYVSTSTLGSCDNGDLCKLDYCAE
jgi:hypothetical protein